VVSAGVEPRVEVGLQLGFFVVERVVEVSEPVEPGAMVSVEAEQLPVAELEASAI
jgi:hypothetical protein